MEGSVAIHEAVETKCRDELDTFGVRLVNTNVFRLRPVDASILRGLLDADNPDETGRTAKIITIAQQENL